MAHINGARLAMEAAGLTQRANFVRQDPAVRKSWKLASEDLHRAWRSTSDAVAETRGAWYRSGNPFGSAVPAGR